MGCIARRAASEGATVQRAPAHPQAPGSWFHHIVRQERGGPRPVLSVEERDDRGGAPRAGLSADEKPLLADERALCRMPGRARCVTYGSIESFRSNNFLHLGNALRRVCTPDPGDERLNKMTQLHGRAQGFAAGGSQRCEGRRQWLLSTARRRVSCRGALTCPTDCWTTAAS